MLLFIHWLNSCSRYASLCALTNYPYKVVSPTCWTLLCTSLYSSMCIFHSAYIMSPPISFCLDPYISKIGRSVCHVRNTQSLFNCNCCHRWDSFNKFGILHQWAFISLELCLMDLWEYGTPILYFYLTANTVPKPKYLFPYIYANILSFFLYSVAPYKSMRPQFVYFFPTGIRGLM